MVYTKKKCNYCGSIVKVNKDDITSEESDNILDYKGKGVYCDLCGSFIEVNIPTKRSTTNTYSYRRHSSRYYARKRSRRRENITLAYGGVAVIVLLVIPIVFFSTGILSPFVSQENTSSTFCLLDRDSGVDVSGTVNSSLYAPRNDIKFNSTEDFYYLGNFYLIVNNVITAHIKVDLRNIDLIWINIDPSNTSLYKPDYHLLSGGSNHNYNIYVINKTG